MEPLTPAQKELYDWLVHYINQNQYAPSIRQMMRAMNLRSPAPVQSRLERLRDKGYVTWIKGAIAAGGLVEPFTDEQSILELPYLLNQDDYYALRVEGNGLVSQRFSYRKTFFLEN